MPHDARPLHLPADATEATPPIALQTLADQVHLRIMATSDLHMHLAPFDYYGDRVSHTVGLARIATLIATARKEAANSLLLDNGDFLQGNPLADFVAREKGLERGEVHPIFAAMNALGYDAGTLGNHEFNYGLDFLLTALAGAQFPVVSANLARRLHNDPCRDQTLTPPYVLLDRKLRDGAGRSLPIRIGLIGFCPPQVVDWDRQHLTGRLRARDILQAARAWLPQMRAEGADIIIALSHSGIGPAEASDGMENASTALARLPEIDALVTGHAHQVFPAPDFVACAGVDAQRGTIFGKPAVMPGFYGSHLGVIDLHLSHGPEGWRVVRSTSQARPIAKSGPDGVPRALVASSRRVLATSAPEHAATRAWTRRSIGRTDLALHSFFALVTDAPACRLVAAAQARHIAKMLRDTPYGELPLLSAVAPFKAGGRGGPQNYTDVPKGALALRHAADLYVYPNTVAALRLTGAEVADWLERAAGLYLQITPGAQDAPLIDPEFPSFNLDLLSGVTYRIDVSQPSRFDPRGALVNPDARRITDLSLNGEPLAPEAKVIVATNSYRIGGNGGFAGARPERVLHSGSVSILEALIDHIAAEGTITHLPAAAWSLAPLPGTTVLLTTSIRALRHIGDLAAFRPEALAGAAPGTLNLRLHL